MRIVQAGVSLTVAATVAVLGITSATAADSVSSGCAGVTVSASDVTSAEAAIAQVSRCLEGLNHTADAAGRVAQQADERYLRAKQAAQQAAKDLQQAQARAERAAAKAKRSREQAGLVAVQLARSGSSNQTSNLLLDGGGAARVLYGLSRMSQLTVESHQISRQAARDSATATRLSAKAAAASQRLHQKATAAGAAYANAKQQADAAAAVVHKQQARVHQLEAQLAALQAPEAPAAAAPASSGSGSNAGSGSGAGLPNASKAARAVAFARAQIGDPYAFGGSGPSSWDCSGLTMAAYASAGVNIGIHSATAQYNLAASRGQLVSYGAARAGDLLFYTDGGGDMYHVAIYSGNGRMIEAPYEGVNVREVPVRTSQLVGQVARPTA
jgi:cell wall-associated NlpC family hydrolase